MKQLAIGILLLVSACTPGVTINLSPTDPCFEAKTAAKEFVDQTVAQHGFGANVFHISHHRQSGYHREVWWGFENRWYFAFTAVGDECEVATGNP